MLKGLVANSTESHEQMEHSLCKGYSGVYIYIYVGFRVKGLKN